MFEISIKVVNGLAETTRHHDRYLLDHAFLRSLVELFPCSLLQLFSVQQRRDVAEFLLYSVLRPDSSLNVTSTETVDDPLAQALVQQVEQPRIVILDADDLSQRVLFPILDRSNELQAVLVYTGSRLDAMPQQVIQGMSQVYGNFLNIIDKAQRDKLTGLYNRETLDDEITAILSQQKALPINATEDDLRRRSETACYWCALLDIDFFKAINDNYGHVYGDEVLILVARLMTSGILREVDRIFRYGGEEFVLLLSAPEASDAQQALERLRTQVATYDFPQINHITVTIGFVQIDQQPSPADVISEADEALYHGKQHGRDQVCYYRQLLEAGHLSDKHHFDKVHAAEFF
ncbi:MAG: GGDEF domain-containing protein [Methylococcales bacterium]|nr:GGDEF domain-containing protein [Methylococcales bacterium]